MAKSNSNKPLIVRNIYIIDGKEVSESEISEEERENMASIMEQRFLKKTGRVPVDHAIEKMSV